MIVLITGTSSGIGLESAVQAASAGHTVVATMRDTSKSQRLTDTAAQAGVDIEVRQLDVTDQASIDACVAGVVADHGALDAVINNAGSGHVGTIELESVDDVRAVMEVNFFGVVAVTRAALPHLRASRGRIVTVSSVGGVVGQPFNEAYCAAKFAVEGFMEALAPVAAALGVTVILVEPGAVRSDFLANVGLDEPSMVAEAGEYGPVLQAYLDRTKIAFDPASAQPPAETAKVIVEALDDPAPVLRVQTSEGARSFAGVKIADLDGSAVLGMTGGWVTAS